MEGEILRRNHIYKKKGAMQAEEKRRDPVTAEREERKTKRLESIIAEESCFRTREQLQFHRRQAPKIHQRHGRKLDTWRKCHCCGEPDAGQSSDLAH